MRNLDEKQKRLLLLKEQQYLTITFPFIFNMLMKTFNFNYHYIVSLIFSIILLAVFIHRNINFTERWYNFRALSFIGKFKVVSYYLFITSIFMLCWGIYIYSFTNPSLKCGSPCFYSDTFQKISTSIAGMVGNYSVSQTIIRMPVLVSER